MESDSTNEDAYRPTNRHNTTLLGQPHELLLQIAAHLQLCRTGALPSLARANKRLLDIAKQAMAQNLVVHQCDIKSAIDWLLQNRDLIPSVTSIDLSTPRSGHAPWCSDSLATSFTEETKKTLAEIFSGSTSGTVSWQDLEDSRHAEWRHPQISVHLYPPRWAKTQHHLIDILLCVCPNIHTITLQTSAEKFQDVIPNLNQHNIAFALPMANVWATPVAPIVGASLQHVQKRLRSLTIAPHHGWAGLMKEEVLVRSETAHFRAHGRDVITLEGIERLEHLDVPMDLLGSPHNLLFRGVGDDIKRSISVPKGLVSDSINNIKSVELAVKILPMSLVWLQVRSCNQYLPDLLDKISTISPEKLRLKKLDFFLDTGARESINRWTLAQSTPTNFLFQINSLRHTGIDITFYDETSYQAINMFKELKLRLAMSNELLAGPGDAIAEEEYMLALMRKQFRDLDLSAVGARRGSRLAHKLFMKHALTHFDLLNRPSFDANSWRGTAFFHGVSNTRFDPSLRPKTMPPAAKDYGLPSWSLIGSALAEAYGLPSFGVPSQPPRRRRGRIDFDNYEFGFTSTFSPSREATLGKKVSFLGADILLRTGPRPIISKKVEDLVEAMQVSDTERDRRADQKECPKKARVTENDPPSSLPGVSQGHKACRATTSFRAPNAIDPQYSAAFEGHRWLKEDWESCLQPDMKHIEEMND